MPHDIRNRWSTSPARTPVTPQVLNISGASIFARTSWTSPTLHPRLGVRSGARPRAQTCYLTTLCFESRILLAEAPFRTSGVHAAQLISSARLVRLAQSLGHVRYWTPTSSPRCEQRKRRCPRRNHRLECIKNFSDQVDPSFTDFRSPLCPECGVQGLIFLLGKSSAGN